MNWHREIKEDQKRLFLAKRYLGETFFMRFYCPARFAASGFVSHAGNLSSSFSSLYRSDHLLPSHLTSSMASCPPSLYPWILSLVSLVSSCLAAPYSASFVQHIHYLSVHVQTISTLPRYLCLHTAKPELFPAEMLISNPVAASTLPPQTRSPGGQSLHCCSVITQHLYEAR